MLICNVLVDYVPTWIRLCLVIRFLHPFVRRTRRRWGLSGPGPRGALSRAGQVPARRRRHVRRLAVPGLPLREVVSLRRPFPGRRRCPVPRAPLLLLKILVLPTVPPAPILPALALVHGERIDVIHHASITVRASHIHSPSQHHRSVNSFTGTIHRAWGNDRDWSEVRGGGRQRWRKREGLRRRRRRAAPGAANGAGRGARSASGSARRSSTRRSSACPRVAAHNTAPLSFNLPNYNENNEHVL